jgi:TPR repeat protein
LRLPSGVSPQVRALYDRCSTTEKEACIALSSMLLRGEGAPMNSILAAELVRRACDAGHARACTALARLYSAGWGTLRDPTRAEALFIKACSQGDPNGCGELGEALLDARSLPFEPGRAVALLQQGCERGSAKACAALANAADRGELPAGSPKPPALRARYEQLLITACEGGLTSACAELAREYRLGRNLPSNALKAIDYAKIGCSRGHRGSCTALFGSPDPATSTKLCDGGDYEACIDVTFAAKLDAAAASPLLERACKASIQRGCWALRGMKSSKASTVFRDACAEGELEACAHYAGEAALALMEKERASAPIDGADSTWVERYKLACEQGSAAHCVDLALREEKKLGAGADRGRIVAAFEQACPPVRWRIDGRDASARGCKLAGDAYREGKGVPKDPARAAELYRRACFTTGRYAGREVDACVTLGDMLDKGDGISRDAVRATALYAGACAVGAKTCESVADRLERGVGAAKDPAYAARVRKGRGSSFGWISGEE